MKSISKSPELILALQSFTQSQNSSKENPKEISKTSQNIVLSGEISSSQIVLFQPTLSKKTSDWINKTHFQNVLTMEDGFYHSDPFQAILKIFPKG